MKTSNTKNEDVNLLVGVVLVVFSILGFFYLGLVYKLMWGWFIVPLGLPELSYLNALGLNLLVNLFSFSNEKKTIKDAKESFMLALTPSLILLVGFLVHLFM